MGDLCLQVCSPVDAIHQYTAAVTESRATLDLLWLASALEGYAAAVLTLLSHKPLAGESFYQSFACSICPNYFVS